MAVMRACVKANPHGFGFVTPTRFFKTMDADLFLSEVATIDPEEPALIHCRYATHGSKCESNCHPFLSDDEAWAFAHNGILSIQPTDDKTDSETAFLRFLPKIQKSGGLNPKIYKYIDSLRGETSKFALMNRQTGDVYTFGNFDFTEGCGFSNRRYEDFLKKKPTLWFSMYE